ncbi:hypothetical protein [Spirosoma gilvum]
MEITHEMLLYLGFDHMPSGPFMIYSYKGFTGRFDIETGTFYFRGFSVGIVNSNDLRFMLGAIDFEHEEQFLPFLPSDN